MLAVSRTDSEENQYRCFNVEFSAATQLGDFGGSHAVLKLTLPLKVGLGVT